MTMTRNLCLLHPLPQSLNYSNINCVLLFNILLSVIRKVLNSSTQVWLSMHHSLAVVNADTLDIIDYWDLQGNTLAVLYHMITCDMLIQIPSCVPTMSSTHTALYQSRIQPASVGIQLMLRCVLNILLPLLWFSSDHFGRCFVSVELLHKELYQY